MMRPFALALALMFPALPALANGWTIQTLGTMPSTEDCMAKARTVMGAYIFDHGGGETASDTWSVYGFALEPGAVDAVLMCPTGGGDFINAILVLYSAEDNREAVSDTFYELWNK